MKGGEANPEQRRDLVSGAGHPVDFDPLAGHQKSTAEQAEAEFKAKGKAINDKKEAEEAEK